MAPELISLDCNYDLGRILSYHGKYRMHCANWFRNRFPLCAVERNKRNTNFLFNSISLFVYISNSELRLVHIWGVGLRIQIKISLRFVLRPHLFFVLLIHYVFIRIIIILFLSSLSEIKDGFSRFHLYPLTVYVQHIRLLLEFLSVISKKQDAQN